LECFLALPLLEAILAVPAIKKRAKKRMAVGRSQEGRGNCRLRVGISNELVLASHQDTQFNLTVIFFGPCILPKGKPAQVSEYFSHTGFVLEFASEECAGTVSIYRIKDGMGGLSDCFVQEKDVFCTIRLFGIPMPDPVLGTLQPLESLSPSSRAPAVENPIFVDSSSICARLNQ
jgi:hypothetical protein